MHRGGAPAGGGRCYSLPVRMIQLVCQCPGSFGASRGPRVSTREDFHPQAGSKSTAVHPTKFFDHKTWVMYDQETGVWGFNQQWRYTATLTQTQTSTFAPQKAPTLSNRDNTQYGCSTKPSLPGRSCLADGVARESHIYCCIKGREPKTPTFTAGRP